MDLGAIVRKIDVFQQKHPVLAFPFAVVKKFGDDSGGYQAALITYYGFLSLFPLLLVLATVLQLLFQNDPQLQRDIATSVSNYFPLLGDDLQKNVHTAGKSGAGLVIGLLFSLYGARGAADALRYALDNMWHVPKASRAGFPKNILHSLSIMLFAGLGFVATVAISAFTSTLGHDLWVNILLNVLGAGVLTLVLCGVFILATAKQLHIKDVWVGAAIAATLVQLLLTFGSILVAQQLKGLDSLYGTFAIVLGLLFWIYLLSRVVVYAAEIDTVRRFKLWPRSITPNTKQPPTVMPTTCMPRPSGT